MSSDDRRGRWLTRREWLALTGAITMGATACGDDTGGDGTVDAGPDPGVDGGMMGDAGDVGMDADVELEVPGLEEYRYDGELGPETLYSHGVASGDPLQDAVILWTRLTLDEPVDTDVFVEMALDPEFNRRVLAEWTNADPARDMTVKVDAFNPYLRPGTTYYYRFSALGRVSPIGRTRTAPDGPVDHLRFGVCSCSNFRGGYFVGYRELALREDLDVVLHLGDYIYEYGGGTGARPHDPPYEIVSLDDYRRRYANYRTDENLQNAHRQHPFIVVWDDHESANNSWENGAENHSPSEGDWFERKAAAHQAYSEWLPIRDQVADGSKIWRSFRFGDLVDLVMLDTRLWGRDQQLEDSSNRDDLQDEERTLLGDEQEQWLADQMRDSTATWRVIGQQVMMGQLQTSSATRDNGNGNIINTDQWDGYQASRFRFLDLLRAENIGNNVVLTGDIHSSWGIDVTDDPNNPDVYDPETGEGQLAVEFTPGITSSGIELEDTLLNALRPVNPHIKYVNTFLRGYMVLDIKPDRVQGAWFHFEAVDNPDEPQFFSAAWSTPAGPEGLKEDDAPAEGKANPPALAPDA